MQARLEPGEPLRGVVPDLRPGLQALVLDGPAPLRRLPGLPLPEEVDHATPVPVARSRGTSKHGDGAWNVAPGGAARGPGLGVVHVGVREPARDGLGKAGAIRRDAVALLHDVLLLRRAEVAGLLL